MDVRVAGSALPTNTKEIKAGTLQDAQAHLEKNRDGLDTYGVRQDGRDLLVVGKGLPHLKAGDRVSINGKEAPIVFAEQENNSFTEGLTAPLKTVAGGATLGAVTVAGAGAGAVVKALKSMIGLKSPQVLPAAALTGVAAAVTVGAAMALAGGIYSTLKSTNEAVTDALK